jgi:hypothetical protein
VVIWELFKAIFLDKWFDPRRLIPGWHKRGVP